MTPTNLFDPPFDSKRPYVGLVQSQKGQGHFLAKPTPMVLMAVSFGAGRVDVSFALTIQTRVNNPQHVFSKRNEAMIEVQGKNEKN